MTNATDEGPTPPNGPPKLRVARRIPASEFDASETLACIDGRHEGPIVGSPGGDAGEFILLLSALEDQSGYRFGESEVESILEEYVSVHGRFYHHTDRAALEALDAELRRQGIEAWTQARNEGTSIEDWLHAPPTDVRPGLLQLLVQPEYVGCGHLQTLLKNPTESGVRRGLVESVIHAFFQLIWRRDAHPDYVVLEGGHAEEAIVVVEDFGDFDDGVPVIEPAQGAPSIFLVHMPIRRHIWRRDAAFIERVFGIPDFGLDEVDELVEQMTSSAERQSETTIQALAPTLPVWIASVDGDQIELSRA